MVRCFSFMNHSLDKRHYSWTQKSSKPKRPDRTRAFSSDVCCPLEAMNRKREWRMPDSIVGAANQSRFPHQTGIPQNSEWAANLSRILSANCEWPIHCIRNSGLRIRAERGFASAVKVRAEHLDQLKAEIERAGPRVALDLEEVDLVDIEGVRFLNSCLAEGMSVLQCSPYIKEWMFRERGPGKPKA